MPFNTSNRIALSFFALLLCSSLLSQTDIDLVNKTVLLKTVKSHLEFIASDELRGRVTGSPELDIASVFLKSQLMSFGVLPPPGETGYFQEVPLVTTVPPESGEIKIGNDSKSFPEDFVILSGQNTSGKFSTLFSEYGNEYSIHDLDLKDKIVVTFCGDGTSENAQSWFYQAEEKTKRMKSAGAVGLIELYQNNRIPFKFLKQQFAKSQMSLSAENEDDFLHIWLNAADGDMVSNLKKNPSIDLKVLAAAKTKGSSRNVIGYVEGTDPELKNQYVVYTAHYDHVGVGRPDAQQDSIYNGARDNGVGVAAILEVARNIASFPTRRSALFVFFTGEEKGLLGSNYFVNNCPVPLQNIVYNLNIDNGGYNDTTIVSVVGLDRTTAGRNIQKSCNSFGLTAIEDPAKEQGLFDRSDNVNFAKKGIPAPTFSLGFRSFDAEIFKYYHQPSDEIASLDFDYLMKYFKAYVLTARTIANYDNAPFWQEGDKYYEAGKELYKK
jgi:hypothetical protein